ncbi:MAG: hypothetical protein ACLP5J_16260, partial [Mycobacterium sp.]|uniref:hypothetical protein n=1 Tax=Mycobacterium sp. TaxID=1785 RepID=UPI003F9B23A3
MAVEHGRDIPNGWSQKQARYTPACGRSRKPHSNARDPLSPGDMARELTRSRHLAQAIPKVGVGRGIAGARASSAGSRNRWSSCNPLIPNCNSFPTAMPTTEWVDAAMDLHRRQ